MSTQSAVRIRMPEKLRNDRRQSDTTEVTTKVPQRWPPPDRHAKTPEANQAQASAQPLAAAPEPAEHDVPLNSAGNNDVADATAQAETDPKSSAAKFASCEDVSCGDKTRTKAQRKEWCRFATVVKVAAKASIKPEDAAQWLEKKTLTGVLAEWRDMQKAAGEDKRKSPVPKALQDYKHLAAALAKDSKFLDLAKGELAKADAAVAKAMAEAAADAPVTAGVQLEGVAADA